MTTLNLMKQIFKGREALEMYMACDIFNLDLYQEIDL